jgi:anti-anti-sigma regulatory factor
MSHKFQASVQHRGDVSYVKLGGVIDEDNELGELVEKIPTGTAVIDLGEIERINSCGVRDWVNWLSKLEYNGTRSVLVECSPAIVAQINLVNNFTGNGVVKSFYVPYFCPECDEEKVLLVEATDMGPPPHEPPTCRCDECDLVMDFDDMPDSYFAFLSNQRKLAEPDKINGAMRDLSRGAEPDRQSGGKVRSRTSQPNLSSGSKPSVPSLPSIQRTSSPVPPMAAHPSGPRGFVTPSKQLGSKPPTGPGARPNAMPVGYPVPPMPANPMSPIGQMPMGPAIGHMGHGQGQGHAQGHGQLGHAGQFAGQMAHGQAHHGMHGHHPQMGNQVNAMGHPGGLPNSPYSFGQSTAKTAAPPKSNTLVFVLIAVLIAAIGVLAYLVATKQQ